MKKLLLGFILCILSISYSNATHIRAGDLVMERISTFTYKFIFTLYRDTEGIAATTSGVFNFGDGSTEEPGVNLVFVRALDNNTDVYRYTTTHTYGAAGRYTVSYRERNRNAGVNNFNASIETQFYIESSFLVSNALDLNRSPVLTIPPVDFANVGQRFIHNPGAFDYEGDSLSYRLTVCKQDKDQDVDGYTFPGNLLWSTNSEDGGQPVFYIDPFTGDLIWDAPGVCGEYNVAFFVDEWRNGVLIGSVNRDMQITVLESDNKRPNLELPNDTCIIANQNLEATIFALDDDTGDKVKITIPQFDDTDGSIFGLLPPSSPAFFVANNNNTSNSANASFSWQTNCNDIRREPYQATFKVEDNRPSQNTTHNGSCLTDGPLSDIQTWRITVVGPKPIITQAETDLVNNDIDLTWEPYTNICHASLIGEAKISVWRREGSFPFKPDNCTTGLPSYTGYQKIESGIDINSTSYTDTNAEAGITYCYRLVVEFPSPRGGESLASDEVCAYIPDNSVLITKVSVLETDQLTGKIEVNWTPPLNENDPDAPPRPYTYKLYKSLSTNEADFEAVFENPISERTFIVDGLNTTENIYYFRVDFFADGAQVDLDSKVASSVRLTLFPSFNSISLTWAAKTPWTNSTPDYNHEIYRTDEVDNDGNPIFSSTPIAVISPLDNGFNYNDEDEDLVENTTYYYKVLTRGAYDNPPDIEKPLENFSQEVATNLIDVDAPCPPSLIVLNSLCENLETSGYLTRDSRNPDDPDLECSKLYENKLKWIIQTTPGEPCIIKDISHYNIYYAEHEGDELTLYQENIVIEDTTNLIFLDKDLISIAGCYAVTAVDRSGNESEFSNIACIDNCPDYYLPNAFSPTVSIGKNDTFKAYPCHRFVDRVEFEVFNRWGKLVFESDENIDIEWDGKAKNGKQVPSGVYFYKATVKFNRLRKSDEIVTYKGTITVLK